MYWAAVFSTIHLAVEKEDHMDTILNSHKMYVDNITVHLVWLATDYSKKQGPLQLNGFSFFHVQGFLKCYNWYKNKNCIFLVTV